MEYVAVKTPGLKLVELELKLGDETGADPDVVEGTSEFS